MKSAESQPPVNVETTFTIDICRSLEVPKKVIKGEYCPNGTRSKYALVETIFDTIFTR